MFSRSGEDAPWGFLNEDAGKSRGAAAPRPREIPRAKVATRALIGGTSTVEVKFPLVPLGRLAAYSLAAPHS